MESATLLHFQNSSFQLFLCANRSLRRSRRSVRSSKDSPSRSLLLVFVRCALALLVACLPGCRLLSTDWSYTYTICWFACDYTIYIIQIQIHIVSIVNTFIRSFARWLSSALPPTPLSPSTTTIKSCLLFTVSLSRNNIWLTACLPACLLACLPAYTNQTTTLLELEPGLILYQLDHEWFKVNFRSIEVCCFMLCWEFLKDTRGLV